MKRKISVLVIVFSWVPDVSLSNYSEDILVNRHATALDAPSMARVGLAQTSCLSIAEVKRSNKKF